MKSLLIGESACRRGARRIRAALEPSPEVRRLIHMRTQHLGPDELLVAAKVEFDADLDVPELARRHRRASRPRSAPRCPRPG